MGRIQREGEQYMKEATITEYHLCNECQYIIDTPGRKPGTWEKACLHPKGKLNPKGGLTDCIYYKL